MPSPPAFDPTQLLMLMQDGQQQKAIVFGLLDTVLANGTAPLDDARQSWRQGNAGHAARQLHTVRGTLGTFGLKRFAAAALAAEQALRSRQAGPADPMHPAQPPHPSHATGTGASEDSVDTMFEAADQALQDGLADMRTWLAAQRLSTP